MGVQNCGASHYNLHDHLREKSGPLRSPIASEIRNGESEGLRAKCLIDAMRLHPRKQNID
jgi:hypothetical protein